MTEDRVHHDESCCWPDQHNGTPHRDCPGAMTEDRVSTPHYHSERVSPFSTAEYSRECHRDHSGASAQPAPPLDVVEVIESFRYSEPLVANAEPHRMWQRNEETLDAILARLGSAATQLPPDEPES